MLKRCLRSSPKQANSESEALSPASVNKIARMFVAFTIEIRSHMKHERTEGQQPVFVNEKSNCERRCRVLNLDYHTSK